MSKRKVGFWKWLWQWSLSIPSNTKRIAKRLHELLKDNALFEMIVGGVGAYNCFGFGILGVSTFPIRVALVAFGTVFVVIFFHGYYLMKMEDC